MRRSTRLNYWKLAVTTAGLFFLALGVALLVASSGPDHNVLQAITAPGDKPPSIEKTVPENRTSIAVSDLAPETGPQEDVERTVETYLQRSIPPARPLSFAFPATAEHGYVFEIPATIEVRQTQADNEFYLKNVSH